MNQRSIIFGIAGFALAYVIERQVVSIASDMSRYDSLRAMSGEPPFVKEQLSRALGIILSFVGEQTSSRGVLGSLPSDIVRYAKLSTM